MKLGDTQPSPKNFPTSGRKRRAIHLNRALSQNLARPHRCYDPPADGRSPSQRGDRNALCNPDDLCTSQLNRFSLLSTLVSTPPETPWHLEHTYLPRQDRFCFLVKHSSPTLSCSYPHVAAPRRAPGEGGLAVRKHSPRLRPGDPGPGASRPAPGPPYLGAAHGLPTARQLHPDPGGGGRRARRRDRGPPVPLRPQHGQPHLEQALDAAPAPLQEAALLRRDGELVHPRPRLGAAGCPASRHQRRLRRPTLRPPIPAGRRTTTRGIPRLPSHGARTSSAGAPRQEAGSAPPQPRRHL